MKKIRYIGLFFFSILIVKFCFYFYLDIVLLCGDSSSYLYNTYNLIDGATPLYHTRPPGYSYFIFLVWKILGNSYSNIVIAQLFLSALAWTLLFHMYTKYVEKTGYIFGFMVLLNIMPYFWWDDLIVYSESFSLSLFLTTISIFGLAIKCRSKMYSVSLSIAVILCFITKSALISTFCLLILLFIYNYNKFNIWINVSTTFVPFVLVLILYSYHNKRTLGSYDLFKFGDFARMMTVNFIIDENFSDNQQCKTALKYYINKIKPQDRAYVNNVSSVFETNERLRDTYSRNCDNIYFYYNYLADSFNLAPFKIYETTKNYVSKGRSKNALVYYNFIFNNAVSFLNNTRQGIIDPEFSVKGALKNYDRTAKEVLFEEHIEREEYTNLIRKMRFDKRSIPKPILKMIFGLYLIFRNVLWIVLFVLAFSIQIIKFIKQRFNDQYNFFNLSLSLITLLYILLVVTTGSGDVDRYALFSDLIFYLSGLYLLYEAMRFYKTTKK